MCIRDSGGSVPYFPICQGTLPWQPNNVAVMKAFFACSPDGVMVFNDSCLISVLLLLLLCRLIVFYLSIQLLHSIAASVFY